MSALVSDVRVVERTNGTSVVTPIVFVVSPLVWTLACIRVRHLADFCPWSSVAVTRHTAVIVCRSHFATSASIADAVCWFSPIVRVEYNTNARSDLLDCLFNWDTTAVHLILRVTLTTVIVFVGTTTQWVASWAERIITVWSPPLPRTAVA